MGKFLDRLNAVIKGDDSKVNEIDMSQDEQDLAAYVKGRVNEVRTGGTRISHESIWMTNIAYVLGFDSIFFDSTQRQFRSSNSAGQYLKRNRLHANKLLPALQNRVSRLCKNPPKWDVRPNTSDHEDKEAARLENQALNQWWDKENINQKRLPMRICIWKNWI
jgi:hypothetical protein